MGEQMEKQNVESTCNGTLFSLENKFWRTYRVNEPWRSYIRGNTLATKHTHRTASLSESGHTRETRRTVDPRRWGGGAGWGVIVERSPVLQDKEGSGDCGLGSEHVVSATKLYTKMWKLANSTFLLQFVLTLQVH